MTTTTLDIDISDGVATITLSHPPVNAVTRVMQDELIETFAGFTEDRTVRAVVLAAQGDRSFCAGIDLREMSEAQAEPPLQDRLNPGWKWRHTQHVMRHCPVPVIAAVERPAIGAGMGLLGVSDIIVASRTASFGLTEINVGLLGGGSKALRMVGSYKTRAMMFTGRLESAEELYRRGVLEDLVEPGEALGRAQEIARLIATKSPMAVRLAKESLNRIEGDLMEEQYRTEWDYTNRLRTLNDSREAMSAYLDKREPEWTWS